MNWYNFEQYKKVKRNGIYEPEAIALFDRMTVQQTSVVKSAVNNTIKALKSNGFWGKIETMLLCGVDEWADSLLNWKGDYFNGSKDGNPAFVNGKGWQVSANNYITINFNPSTQGTLYSLNDASVSIFNLKDVRPGIEKGDIGCRSDSNRTRIKRSASSINYAINMQEDVGNSVFDSKGWTFISKDSDYIYMFNDDSRTLRINNPRWQTINKISISVPNSNFRLGQDYFNYSDSLYGGCIIGSKFTEVESHLLQKILFDNWHLPMNNYYPSICVIGDSIMDNYGATSVCNLIDSINTYKKTDLTVTGSSVASRLSAWNGLDSYIKKGFDSGIFILIGINDIVDSSITVLNSIQTLVNRIKLDNNKSEITLLTLTPYRISAYCTPEKYIVWQEINAGIMNTGVGAIIGVDNRINSHTLELDNGDGSLKSVYDSGDHLHPNLAGKNVIASVIQSYL